MRQQKPTVKKASLQENAAQALARFADEAMQKLFGAGGGWRKLGSIAQNNYDLGLSHLAQGHARDAVFRFKIVTWMQPRNAGAWYYLGCGALADKQPKMAQAAFRKALALRPGYEEAVYMLAVAGGSQTPDGLLPKTMPLTLARNHFDALAEEYEREQLETYHYQGHRLLCDSLRACLTPGRMDHDVLELGVGTGLCGPLLRDVAAQLTGVDLSSAMIAQAMKREDGEGRKLYDALICRDLRAFLEEAPTEQYDVIVAANVFGYVGELEEVFRQAARALKPGGLFAFTADQAEGEGFRLDTAHGRFGFSQGYLRGLAAMDHFREITFDHAPVYPDYAAWLCIFAR